MQRPLLFVAGALVAALVAGALLVGRTTSAPEVDDPIGQACALSDEILTRIWRGHDPARSEDVTAVPRAPNYLGSFSVTSHSGPWDYLQRVPLVLYGPERVEDLGPLPGDGVTLADVYPTVGEWTGVDLPARYGTSLREAVRRRDHPPKLLVFVMWDGAGRNVLERWPERWPHLRRLEQEGTSYLGATVGSSPSITPSTHATLGTGAFPRHHGITGIQLRDPQGELTVAQVGNDPRDLKLTTFADELDRAFDERAKVGLVGVRQWQIPMMGHGAALERGDKDQLVLIGFEGRIRGQPDFFDTPGYLRGYQGFDERADALDERDGVRDGRWRDHPIGDDHDNPAWAAYQTDMVLEMLAREGYGADDVPDLFFVNYKMTDRVGHRYSMDSAEMAEVVEAQDAALGRLVGYLDDQVGDYALVVTADHGSTPSPERTGAWPIVQDELEDDLNEYFEVPEGSTLKDAMTAVGPFLDRELMREQAIALDEVARFLMGYTIRDNWATDELPPGYEERGDERVFEAAFPSDRLDEVMVCAFGSDRPPGS